MSLNVDFAKHFPGFDLQMAFSAGDETLGLLGESGCGKSLTMRSIAGIETPDEGKIEVNGMLFFDRVKGKKPTVNLTPQQRKTAVLFQNYMLFPNMTVAQNVAAGIPRSTPKAEAAEIVARELRRFSVDAFEKRYPAQLSGGQQQRVALARMLAAKPGILMLDEPFSALDAHLKGVLEQNLVTLFEEFQGTILYVSHDIDEAMRFCDRIAVVNAGHIEELDTCDELFSAPRSEAALKLSGVKNICDGERLDAHTVRLPRWGIDLTCTAEVPADVKKVGIRAFSMKQVEGPGPNCFKARVDRVSDSRYDRTVLLDFQVDRTDHVEDGAVVDEMKYLHNHCLWRIDKMLVPADKLPNPGDVLWLHIPEEKVLLVSR